MKTKRSIAVYLFLLTAFSGPCFTLSLFPNATVFASMPAVNRFEDGVAAIQGVWYDLEGNEAFSVAGTSFDGRRILGAANLEGSRQAPWAEFRIANGQGEEPSRVSITWTPSHRFLIVGGKPYRNTKEPEHFESVRSVFLGMKKEDALALLGEPTENVHDWKFIYPDLSIHTSGGMVTAIVLPGSGARLDGSGLGADDAPEDFAKAYDFPEGWDGQESREIGSYGEYLQRKGTTIILSLSK